LADDHDVELKPSLEKFVLDLSAHQQHLVSLCASSSHGKAEEGEAAHRVIESKPT